MCILISLIQVQRFYSITDTETRPRRLIKMHIKEYLNRSPLCKWSIVVENNKDKSSVLCRHCRNSNQNIERLVYCRNMNTRSNVSSLKGPSSEREKHEVPGTFTQRYIPYFGSAPSLLFKLPTEHTFNKLRELWQWCYLISLNSTSSQETGLRLKFDFQYSPR